MPRRPRTYRADGVAGRVLQGEPERDGRERAVDPNTQRFRFRTVQSFLAAGISVCKLNQVRGLLERSGHTIGGHAH
eukprot:212113-Prymnesium_polylepis.1